MSALARVVRGLFVERPGTGGGFAACGLLVLGAVGCGPQSAPTAGEPKAEKSKSAAAAGFARLPDRRVWANLPPAVVLTYVRTATS